MAYILGARRHVVSVMRAGFCRTTRALASAASVTPTRPSMQQRVATAAAYAFFAANVGALFTNQNESLVALDTYSAVIEKQILDTSGEADGAKLEKALEVLARGLPLCDSLRARVAGSADVLQRLLELCAAAPTVAARYSSAKALESTCALPSARADILDAGVHIALAKLASDAHMLTYVRKSAASALAQLSSDAARAAAAGDARGASDVARLAAGGVIGALDVALQDPGIARQRMRGALVRLCDALDSATDGSRELAPREREVLAAHRAAVAAAAAGDGAGAGSALQPALVLVDSARTALVEGGALMYMHTAAGGLVWGAAESLRARMGPRAVLRHAAITSTVTCLLPIVVVGGCVTVYHKLERMTDTRAQKMAMYTSGALLLYPGWLVMQRVEAIAPYWLGGHIVGFMSFFAWLRYTHSDLLRSDAELHARDRALMADQAMKPPAPAEDASSSAAA